MRSATKNQVGKHAAYLEWIRSLPCICCLCLTWSDWLKSKLDTFGLLFGPDRMLRRNEAAHVGRRGLSQKCSDRETVPLCALHHRTGILSHHVLGKGFWAYWKIDRDALVKALNERYEEEHANAIARVAST